MSANFYVPPAEVYARLLSYSGQHVITKGSQGWHERCGNYTPIVQASAGTDSDDQYWSLEKTGYLVYLMRNKSMGKVILVGSSNDPAPLMLVDGSLKTSASACSFITLEPGKGQYEGYFRILRICNGNVGLMINKPSRLEIATFESLEKVGQFPISGEQYFTFDYEPMDVVSIDYNLKESRRFNEKPHILVDTYLSNDTGSEQTLTYELNEKTSTTSKWDYKVGFKFGITRKIKTGIPKMAEGELVIDTSLSFEWSQGETYTTEQSWKASFPVKARSGERVRAKSSVWVGNVEVPYTLVMKTRAGHRVEQKGIWHGVLAWNLRHELKAEKPNSAEVRIIDV